MDIQACRQDVTPKDFRDVIPKALEQVASHPHGWGEYREADDALLDEGLPPPPTWLQVRLSLVEPAEQQC